MALNQRLDLRQGQSLVMTPQLQQAIKLLQMSNMELQAFVDQELERNPLKGRSLPPGVKKSERLSNYLNRSRAIDKTQHLIL